MSDKSRLLLPPEYSDQVRDVAALVNSYLATDFRQAEAEAQREIDLLRGAEEASGRDLHKGHPLYSIGVARFPRDPAEARTFFAAAFAEDVRTYQAPRRHLAARALRSLLEVPSRVLRELARRAVQELRRDPYPLAARVVEEFDLPAYEPLFAETEPDDFLLEVGRSDLVFVGGSYRLGGDRVYQMAEQVLRCGLRPVIVGALRRRPNESEREKSFRILDLCGLAAFDGTAQERPGWWAEVERIINTTKIPTLIAFFADRSTREYSASAMFPSQRDHPRLTTRPFGTNLDAVVRKWLQEEHEGPLACRDGDARTAGASHLLSSNTPYRAGLVPSGYPSLPGSAVPYLPSNRDRQS